MGKSKVNKVATKIKWILQKNVDIKNKIKNDKYIKGILQGINYLDRRF